MVIDNPVVRRGVTAGPEALPMTIHLTRRPTSGTDDRMLADRLVSDILAAGGRRESLTAEVLVLMLWSAGHRTDVEARARRVADIIAHGVPAPVR
ncbi:MAG: hypothetical protein PGN29_00180 [Gordonia paraffinivorans]